MARWIQARRTSLSPDGRRRAEAAGAPAGDAMRLEALRTVAGGIGTTLDEGTTCAEPTRAAVRLAGGAAAVMRRTGKTLSGYQAVIGPVEVLPEARQRAGRTDAVRGHGGADGGAAVRGGAAGPSGVAGAAYG